MDISAKADYALRALIALAAMEAPRPVSAEALARAQNLPVKFLENTFVDLRRAGLLRSQRGAEGGYTFARDPKKVTAAEVIRMIDGPLAEVRGLRPEATEYAGASVHLQELWIAVRASMRAVLENVTIADLATGRFPKRIQALIADPDAWLPH